MMPNRNRNAKKQGLRTQTNVRAGECSIIRNGKQITTVCTGTTEGDLDLFS